MPRELNIEHILLLDCLRAMQDEPSILLTHIASAEECDYITDLKVTLRGTTAHPSHCLMAYALGTEHFYSRIVVVALPGTRAGGLPATSGQIDTFIPEVVLQDCQRLEARFGVKPDLLLLEAAR